MAQSEKRQIQRESQVRKFNDRSYLVKEDGSDVILRRNRYFLKPYFINNSGYISDSESESNLHNEEDEHMRNHM
jgi:hypothetical protein